MCADYISEADSRAVIYLKNKILDRSRNDETGTQFLSQGLTSRLNANLHGMEMIVYS